MSSSNRIIAALTLTKLITVFAISTISFQVSAEKSVADKDVKPKPLICLVFPKCGK